MNKDTIGLGIFASAVVGLGALAVVSSNEETPYDHGDCVEDELRDLNGNCVHVDKIVEERLDTFTVVCEDKNGEVIAGL